MLTACAYLVTGDLQPLGAVSEIELRRLLAEGLTGRALVHALITDDWAAPPRLVEVTGTDAKGHPVSLRIPYD